MSYHELEQVALAFSLGVIARPVARLLVDEHRRHGLEAREAERLARAEALRRPLPHPRSVEPPPHPSRSVLPPRYLAGDR